MECVEDISEREQQKETEECMREDTERRMKDGVVICVNADESGKVWMEADERECVVTHSMKEEIVLRGRAL